MTTRAGENTQQAAQRQRDAERTRNELIDAATDEFARLGYAGARVDEIAARTRITKRMIYYYFGGKEGLYLAVLERAYAGIREYERQLDVGNVAPTDALRRLVELTFDYQQQHPKFNRLVMSENINGAEHLAKSSAARPANTSAVDLLEKILTAGQATGEFVSDVTALELHLMISALCFFRVSNRPTIRAIFDYDMCAADTVDRQRRLIADMVVKSLQR